MYEIGLTILAVYGLINGYVTSRNLKCYGTTDWVYAACVAGFVLPTLIVIAVMLESLFAWLNDSPLRYNFLSAVFRICLWYVSNGVFCYVGAYCGY